VANGKPRPCSIKAFTWAARFASAGMSFMSDRTFVDTNVLIYAHNLDAGAKRQIANTVLRELWSERTGVLSMQVLQEFYVNVTRKIAAPLSKNAARLVVESYAVWCVEIGPAEIYAAFRIEDQSRIGFWDALIVSSAAKSGASRILSEDLSDGQRIAGVLIENPFAPARS
jgi:predicted nucleic acid-binding protein